MESSVKNLEELLSKVNIRSLLVNGNVEKQIKFLLASNHDHEDKWFLMDKKVAGHEIDLIFLERDKIVSVAELKCTFVCDTKDSVIFDAIEKAEKTKTILSKINPNNVNVCNGLNQYIIHFLLLGNPRVVDNFNRPSWIARKYPHPADYTPEHGQDFAKKIFQKYVDKFGEPRVSHIEVKSGALDMVLVKLHSGQA